jgi:hypothetical protein
VRWFFFPDAVEIDRQELVQDGNSSKVGNI